MKRGLRSGLVLVFILCAVLTSGSMNVAQGGDETAGKSRNGTENPDRFARAEEYGQFIQVDKAVDCKGTRVTIEKILLDKIHTFMIASVDGDIKGNMDYINVDLFDEQNQEMGRSSFLQVLPDGKTLLTFEAFQKAPVTLRLEFFGGPVGYGDGPVILTLDNLNFKTVAEQYTQEYLLAETAEKEGYKLVADSIVKGISETSMDYKLAILGDYDGIRHGWLYDWHNNFSPEGEILFMHDSGRKLGLHLSSLNCLGPFYRIAQDQKTIAGKANFDRLETNDLQIELTNIYGYYHLNEIIPLEGVTDRMEINRKLSVKDYVVHMQSFSPGDDKDTWILEYSVRDLAGNIVDADIEAGIYMKSDDYRMPMTINKWFHDSNSGNQCLAFNWQPPQGEDSLILGPAIKISKLGIRQDDAVLNINLDNPVKRTNQDETQIMAAVNKYYQTLGQALISDDMNILANKYGYLQPTGASGDGINDWQRHFQTWRGLGVRDYTVTLEEPILTIKGDKATIDLAVNEKMTRNDGGDSGRGFTTVFYLEKVNGKWMIAKIDDLTEFEWL